MQLQYVGTLFVYLIHILYHHLQLISDIEIDNLLSSFQTTIVIVVFLLKNTYCFSK